MDTYYPINILQQNINNEKFISNLILNDHNNDLEIILDLSKCNVINMTNKNSLVTQLIDIKQIKIFFEYFKKNKKTKYISYSENFIHNILKNLMHNNNQEDIDYVIESFIEFYPVDFVRSKIYKHIKYYIYIYKQKINIKILKIIKNHLYILLNSMDKIFSNESKKYNV